MARASTKESKYASLTLPFLYRLCHERGIKNYCFKTEEEAVALLVKYDDENDANPEEDISQIKPEENEMAKDDIDELDDDIVLDDELSDEGESVTDKVNKRLEGKDETPSDDIDDLDDLDLDDSPSEEAAVEEPAAEAKEDDIDDDIGDLDDEIDSDGPETHNSKEKNVAAKKTDEKKTEKKTEDKSTEKKAPAEKKDRAPRKKVGDDPDATSPFVPTTAGHFVFMTLLKSAGKKINLDKIVEVANAAIEKKIGKEKLPKDTKAKAKIIIGEINSGKRGDKWGKFEVADGKVTHIPQ